MTVTVGADDFSVSSFKIGGIGIIAVKAGFFALSETAVTFAGIIAEITVVFVGIIAAAYRAFSVSLAEGAGFVFIAALALFTVEKTGVITGFALPFAGPVTGGAGLFAVIFGCLFNFYFFKNFCFDFDGDFVVVYFGH